MVCLEYLCILNTGIMILVRKRGERRIHMFGTVSKMCNYYPEFSKGYLQNLRLDGRGYEYKDHIIYRVYKTA